MKVVYGEKKASHFESIKRGEAFTYAADIYMKTEEVFFNNTPGAEMLNAINLESGEMIFFEEGEEVKILPNAKIVIE